MFILHKKNYFAVCWYGIRYFCIFCQTAAVNQLRLRWVLSFSILWWMVINDALGVLSFARD